MPNSPDVQNPQTLAAALKVYVESGSRFPADAQMATFEGIDTLGNALAQADKDALIEMIMALGGNFADAESPDGAVRTQKATSYILDGEVADLVKRYIEVSGGFDRLYQSLGAVEYPVEAELVVEKDLDQAVQQLEARLAQVDSYVLVGIILALSSNYPDAATPEGKQRLHDALNFFLDFDGTDVLTAA